MYQESEPVGPPQSPMYELRGLVKGFRVHMSRFIRNDDDGDIVLLNISGPPGAVKATHMALRTRKTNHWKLGGPSKFQKLTGHQTIKTELPNGWASWVTVSNQAIPTAVNANATTFFWTIGETSKWTHAAEPPDSFMPMFMATVPIPTHPDWAPYLWEEGIATRTAIVRCSNSTGVTAYRLSPNMDTWSRIITEGFDTKKINLYGALEWEDENAWLDHKV
jgi:hypothetical protein